MIPGGSLLSGSAVPPPCSAETGGLGFCNGIHIFFATVWYNTHPIILLVKRKMIDPFTGRRDIALYHWIIFEGDSIAHNNSKVFRALCGHIRKRRRGINCRNDFDPWIFNLIKHGCSM